jgi:hypothetical protein
MMQRHWWGGTTIMELLLVWRRSRQRLVLMPLSRTSFFVVLMTVA